VLRPQVYCYTARSLYEKHKLLFTLLLALKIDLQAGRISHPEVLTFLKGHVPILLLLLSLYPCTYHSILKVGSVCVGGASLDLNSVESKPRRWILDQTWLNLVQLSSLPPFSQILTQVQPRAVSIGAGEDVSDLQRCVSLCPGEPERALLEDVVRPPGAGGLPAARRLRGEARHLQEAPAHPELVSRPDHRSGLTDPTAQHQRSPSQNSRSQNSSS